MTVQAHPMGLGESLGDDLIINGPLLHTGNVWWVNSDGGSDAASPRGLERSRPLASLEQAISNASNDDIIVLMDGHAETKTESPLVVNKRLTIVGSGQSDGEPTVELGVTGPIIMMSVTAAYVELRNIKFVERSTSHTEQKINVSGANFRMRGCRMECGDNDAGIGINITGDYATLQSCTFVSTADTTPPRQAVRPAMVTGFRCYDCTFDGGTDGWENGWALDQVDGESASDTVAVLIENVTLLRGSDIRLHTDSSGRVLVSDGSGAARVEWTGA